MTTNSKFSKKIKWKDIEPLISEKKYKTYLKNIDPKTFLLVLDEGSCTQVVETILRMLKQQEPKNATQEYAEDIVNSMQKIAKKYKRNHSYKSFLMGASQINDSNLTSLSIEIIKDTDPEVRKLLIPAVSIEGYKSLIRKKLDVGYWNDFVGEDQIYFIFKMSDGEIKEYKYSEEKRLEIARLCSDLNKDPIEKTSDLLNYMAENDFYTDVIEKFKKTNDR